MTALLFVLAGCTQATEEAPPPVHASGDIQTREGKYQIHWQASTDPIVLGELFEIDSTLKDKDGKTVETASVTVDARMPQHGHGMSTRPQQQQKPDGHYQSSGMKFHMPGEWTIIFVVDGPAGPDRAEVVYKL